jgi:DtxR family Mn-dependent transcriptional regulator
LRGPGLEYPARVGLLVPQAAMNDSSIIVLWLMLAAGLFLPRVGLFARWRRARQVATRFRREDALKHLLKSEANGQTPTLDGVAGALQIKPSAAARLLEDMEERGLVSHDQGRLRLRRAGREIALHVVRAHRLWESYLADQTGVAENEWHHRAEKQEHLLSKEQTEFLASRLGHPTRDPHGDAIPREGGRLPADLGQSLNTAEPNTPLRITHVEDEPETIYAQLIAQGLRPGMPAVVIEKSPERIRFWANGQEHVLAPLLANNISVEPLPAGEAQDLYGEQHLAELQPGQQGRILGLAPACHGAERRRLLDLGFVPGTKVEVEMVSPAGDPTAYRIRGAVIALRQEQARLIRVAARDEVPA